MPVLVTQIAQVIENIKNFNVERNDQPVLDMISYVRHWYAIMDNESRWLFAPSKFIGYVEMTPRTYRKAFDHLDGRVTEARLNDWFEELDTTNKLDAELREELRRLLAQHGKTLNKLARIHVLKGERALPERNLRPPSGESWRITSDAGVLGGKPCIRGMRIRVADILELLAHGASRAEILEDFPYIEDGDITAALEYAMGTVNHRLIKAA